MNKKLLMGILAGAGIVLIILNPAVMGFLAIVFWIYLEVIAWKRKRIFHEKINPGLAEKLMKRLKAILILAGISCLVSVVGIIVHNVGSSLSESKKFLYFIIGITALYVFILASAGGLFIFIKGRQKSI